MQKSLGGALRRDAEFAGSGAALRCCIRGVNLAVLQPVGLLRSTAILGERPRGIGVFGECAS
jgi:hypothetical protein